MNHKEEWLKCYRSDKSAIWIKVFLDDGSYYFFKRDDLTDWWTQIKIHCNDVGARIEKMSLQFRSHEVHIDTIGSGMYLAKAAKGFFGGDTTEFIVTGRLKGEGKTSVIKTWWQIPELVVEKKVIDPIDLCFEDMVIRYEEAAV